MPAIIDLQAALANEMAAYHVAADAENRRQLDARSAKIKAIRDAVNAAMREGTHDCPRCKSPALVILKTPEIKGAKPAPPVYEVGCPVCPDRARHWTREGAIEKWNAGEVFTNAPS